MAESSKTWEATLRLMAKIDGSFKSSIQQAEKMMKGLDKITERLGKTGTSGFSAIGKSASHNFGIVERSAERAHGKISKLFEGLKFGFGFGIGNALFGAAQNAAGTIGEGSGIAATREGIRTQTDTLMKNQGQGAFTDKLIMQMRTYADQESVFHFNEVQGVANQLLASKVRSDKILPLMRMMGDLSKDDETLKLVGDITAQASNQGYLTKGNLTRLVQDAKVPIYAAVLKAMGKEDNQANEVALFKRLRTPGKDPVPYDVLLKAYGILTGPGGELHGHQLAQLNTFAGQKSSLDDRKQDFLGGVGDTWNGFIEPLMREVNKVGPGTISGWFDTMKIQAKDFGQDLANAFDIEGRTGKIQDIANQIGGIFSKSAASAARMFGAFSNGASTTENLVAVINKVDDGFKWINDHWSGVANGIKLIGEAFIGLKLLSVGSQLASIAMALGNISKFSVPAGLAPLLEEGATAVGAGIVGPALLGGAVAGGLGYMTYQGLHANDATLHRDALLAQSNADLSAGGPKQSDAQKAQAMADHERRYSDLHTKSDSAWHSMADPAGDFFKGIGDRCNGVWEELKKSSDAEIKSVDDTKNAFDVLHNAVEPVGGAFGKVANSAGTVASALDRLTAKIDSWRPPSVSLNDSDYLRRAYV